MKGVDFIEKNEFHIKSRKLFGDPTTPTMITILLKTGLAKNEKQALTILIGIIIAALSLTAWIANSQFNPPTSNLVIDQKNYETDRDALVRATRVESALEIRACMYLSCCTACC